MQALGGFSSPDLSRGMRVLFYIYFFLSLIIIFPGKEVLLVLLLYGTLGFGLVMMVMVTSISTAYTVSKYYPGSGRAYPDSSTN